MEILASQDATAIEFDEKAGLFAIKQRGNDFQEHAIYVAKANMARFIQALEDARKERES